MADNENKSMLDELAEATGGSATLHEIKDADGCVVHSFGTMSFPLRKTHWIYEKAPDGFGHPPPMPLRMASDAKISLTITESKPDDPGWVKARTLTHDRRQMSELIRMAGRYAVRSTTMHGAEMDFDPDARLPEGLDYQGCQRRILSLQARHLRSDLRARNRVTRPSAEKEQRCH